jgi:3-oxoacyl-[acyl-carrier-protein] synthase II
MSTADTADPVVITGVGVVSPLGPDAPSTWRAVQSGLSAPRRLTADDFPPAVFDPRWGDRGWIGAPAAWSGADHADRVVRLGQAAAREATAEAGLPPGAVDPLRLGCVFGTSKGSLFAATTTWRDPQQAGLFPAVWPSAPASALAADLGVQGPCLAPVAACATGLVAVIRAAALIREGACDVVLAGSADDSLHPLVLASFQRLGVLTRHADPARASRPFDRDRTGFVIGAGAGALILERRSQATARGARCLAVLGPGRFAADPSGITTLDATGDTLARLLADCVPTGRTPDYVNLHGTGTRLNDPAECRALRTVGLERCRAGSLKGSLGHLLGAAGSVELALLCLALRDQVLPPNANLDTPDPACDLPWVGGTAEPARVTSILKVSLGFGGHQAALWLERGDAQPESRPENHEGSKVAKEG